ncbi:MAG: biotin/lipoyl-containing protein [Bacilli bacterium]
MKIYKVKVNGKVYEVELESVTEKDGSIAAPTAIQSSKPAGEGQKIITPMAGNILDVKVEVGQKIKKGQVVAILEAMKLENEIVSTCEGTVQNILVKKGESVNAAEAIMIVG